MKQYLTLLVAGVLLALLAPMPASQAASTPTFTASVNVNGTPLANGSPDVVGTAAMLTVTPAIPASAFATQTALAASSPTNHPTSTSTPTGGAMAIAYVQKNATTNGSGDQTSVTCNFASAQTVGNLIIVSITGNTRNSDVTSVTDTKGNTYAVANPWLQNDAGSVWNKVYYAKNIAAAAAGANTVTVAMTSTNSSDVRIYEFSGLATSAPLDQYNGAIGSTNPPNSGNVTTTVANELLFGSIATASNANAAGTGWTLLQITTPNADADEYKIVSSTGTYSSTFDAVGSMVTQIATFEAAGAVAFVQPPHPIIVRQAVQRAAVR